MNYKARSISQIKADIKSAGKSFISFNIEDMLSRLPELDDKVKKEHLIEEYYENQTGFYDKEIGGTRTRVNSVIRIIRANQVQYTLEEIIENDSRVDPKAIKVVQTLLSKIGNGEFTLPIIK